MKSNISKVVLISVFILLIVAGTVFYVQDDIRELTSPSTLITEESIPAPLVDNNSNPVSSVEIQKSENKITFVAPKSVLYIGEGATGPGPLFSSEFTDMVGQCQDSIVLEATSEYAKTLSPRLEGLEPILAILTPHCAYFVADRLYKGSIPTITLKKIADGEKETFNVLSPLWNLPYYSYGGKLYHGAVVVPADPLSFKEGYGFCGKYFIADGVVLIREKKTQIPESACGQSSPLRNTLKTIDDAALYKGETEAYLFAGESDDGSNLATVVVPLAGLKVSMVKEVGRYNNTFFFTDGEKVIRIVLDMIDPPTLVFVEELTIDDPTSFESLSAIYSRDSNSVYFNGDKMNSADRDTFTALKNLYAKDNQNVYFRGKILVNADAKSFGVVFDYGGGFESQSVYIARDGSGLWYEDKKVIDVPIAKTLYLVPSGKWTDPNTYITDGERIVAYNDGATLTSKIPSGFLDAIKTKDYPQNVKLIENLGSGMLCSVEEPGWYYTSWDDESTNSFLVSKEELKAYCIKCPYCR